MRAFLVLLLCGSYGCGYEADSRALTVEPTCSISSENVWIPSVPGVGVSNHDDAIAVTETVLPVARGPVIGVYQPAPASKEITVSVDMTEDLGVGGSVSLLAEVVDVVAPADFENLGIFPVLVYLSDGTNEYINLARAGSGGDCAQTGYFVSQVANTNCAVNWPSAFTDRTHWQQHQINGFNTPSVNTFPTCNWSGGSVPPTNEPQCAFNEIPWFVDGKLRSGVTYTAKYVLLADGYEHAGSTEAGLKVTVVKKAKDSLVGSGAIDLNVILVGSKNVVDSHTEKGHQNLDTLMAGVHGYFNTTSPGPAFKLGKINVIEWCDSAAEAYSAGSDSAVGAMFEVGSKLVASDSTEYALNVFIVSYFTNKPQLLGRAGGIGGPSINGTRSSGLVFASFNDLAEFNPFCSGTGICPLTSQDGAFYDMAATIAHEIGHYLGLNHPSESGDPLLGTQNHDVVLDTPVCTNVDWIYEETTNESCYADSGVHPITGLRCNQVCAGYSGHAGVFCSTMAECQFNHLMWYKSKYFKRITGTGDGNLISDHSALILNYSPFVR